MTKRAIGIVGGMGPAAGLDVADKILSNTKAQTDQEHLDQILFSFPAEIGDRTDFITGKVKENPGIKIAETILDLEKAGATTAGIACNTAHAPVIFDIICDTLKQKNSKIKLLNMIGEVALFIKNHYPKVRNVGIMGTTGTHITSLFNLLEEYGLTIINIPDSEQELLHSAIYDSDYGIKSSAGKVSKKAESIILNSCRMLKAKGAELIVFGCTEFPVAYKKQNFEGLPVIDTNLVLARALIKEFAPEKLKPWDC